jgi:SAM-dependent methyltransferase
MIKRLPSGISWYILVPEHPGLNLFRQGRMKPTSDAYAQVYDKHFTGFSDVAAAHITKYFNTYKSEQLPPVLLDVFCGPGRVACFLARHGYRVYGVDNSQAMLARAKRHAEEHAVSISLLNADALDFELPEKVSFATATTNALCSLPDLGVMRACLAQIRSVIRDDGLFVFDMNTNAGMRLSNPVSVREFMDEFFVIRTIFSEESSQGISRTSGFVRPDGGSSESCWERFDDTMVETTHPVADILSAARQAGWSKAWAAGLPHLGSPLPDPEQAERCFFVAQA